MPYVATDIVVPVRDLRPGDTILDGGEVFRLYRRGRRADTQYLTLWDGWDAGGDLVPLDLGTNDSRRVVGREG